MISYWWLEGNPSLLAEVLHGAQFRLAWQPAKFAKGNGMEGFLKGDRINAHSKLTEGLIRFES